MATVRPNALRRWRRGALQLRNRPLRWRRNILNARADVEEGILRLLPFVRKVCGTVPGMQAVANAERILRSCGTLPKDASGLDNILALLSLGIAFGSQDTATRKWRRIVRSASGREPIVLRFEFRWLGSLGSAEWRSGQQ